jgi:hypothetical protein
MPLNRLYLLMRDGLATMRLTSLLVFEVGPADILERFRYGIGIRHDDNNNPYAENIIGEAFLCYKCASIWCALTVRLLPEFLRDILALSGIAIRWQR